MAWSGACRKISSTREQNELRAAQKFFLFWGWPEKFWGWVFWDWNTMFWGWKWWWVTTQTAPKWISYYMQTLNIIYLTLGRIRGLNISFKIHVATCSMQYTTSCHEWSPEQRHWFGWGVSQSEQEVLGLLGQSEQYYSKPILVYQGVLGLECRLTTNKLVVVGISYNQIQVNRIYQKPPIK